MGIFFDRAEGGNYDNPLWTQLLEDGIPASGVSDGEFDLDLKDVLYDLNLGHFWSYAGSLTTPPCTEGINWTVLKEVQPISDA